MAYENQGHCPRCGKSVPPMPEDAQKDEQLCDLCNDTLEHLQTAMQILSTRGYGYIEIDRLMEHIERRLIDYGSDFVLEQAIDGYLEDQTPQNNA